MEYHLLEIKWWFHGDLIKIEWRFSGEIMRLIDGISMLKCCWLPVHLHPQSQDSSLYWLVVSTYPSEQYDFVSWDHDIPNWLGKNPIQLFQTTNQFRFDSFEVCTFQVFRISPVPSGSSRFWSPGHQGNKPTESHQIPWFQKQHPPAMRWSFWAGSQLLIGLV